jgi:hypothetical protein
MGKTENEKPKIDDVTKPKPPFTLKDLIDKFKDHHDAEIIVTLVRSDSRGSTTFTAKTADLITLMNASKPCIEMFFTEYIPDTKPPQHDPG